MAAVKLEVIEALRKTARALEEDAPYMWGHMGSCNCGNLAQQVTRRTKAEIHAFAMQGKGDWNEQLNDYCSNTSIPLDLVIFDLISFGFTTDDLKNLERLSDHDILNRTPLEKRHLRHNCKDDVVVYLNEWADMLEEKLLEEITLPRFIKETNYA